MKKSSFGLIKTKHSSKELCCDVNEFMLALPHKMGKPSSIVRLFQFVLCSSHAVPNGLDCHIREWVARLSGSE